MPENKKSLNIQKARQDPDDRAKNWLKIIEKSIENLQKGNITKPVDINRYL